MPATCTRQTQRFSFAMCSHVLLRFNRLKHELNRAEQKMVSEAIGRVIRLTCGANELEVANAVAISLAHRYVVSGRMSNFL